MRQLQLGRIASIIGRFYAMDRDKRYDRVEKAYDLLTQAKSEFVYSTITEALHHAYARGETDEFVQATVIASDHESRVVIQDMDSVIFMNFRADRARQLSYALTQEHFSDFNRTKHPKLGQFVTLTEYATTLNATVVYQPEAIRNGLGEHLSHLGLKQLRIAETEKICPCYLFL